MCSPSFVMSHHPTYNTCYYTEGNVKLTTLLLFSVLCGGNTTTDLPTHSNITAILNNLLMGYDSRLRPEYGGK